ncbi:TIGR04063 family PEP-CTERM/XrtA system glycosyltransferase [Accumulibacter sp.]|uniref:TIGR04063 family PEP-CTERM/XrtA system glycosyltransferase n=1 Tax=Accumulibacter sp. TaxID=2053492 RepID=UPI0025CF0DA5|nr:TIGR04063 family PEP-CTERM/XrtA system glycosyltransferase [Accumulibacter sp.]MCM8595411.1 glycosyltransferase, exosortase A system-associated [Accumulibacter sp.]MCM8626408.1 glycosyltransferase, exosortase A system-associated [Accumulibacter sp.]MDS4049558.1 glycosyltransferase, exosortase A system-associated [Accumulibacter sp.]
MRVLHILDHSLPLHSGYSFRTVSILREQRALGWETFHLTTPKQGSGAALQEEADGWTFYRTPAAAGVGMPSQMRLTAARLNEIVEAVRPDLLHAHSPVLNALPALWVGRRHRLPVVYEIRAFWEDAAVDHGSTTEGSLRYRASRAIETFAAKRADQLTTICEGLRRDLIDRGIPPERITVIPNAVDVARFRFGAEPDPELRRSLGLEGATVIGFAGSFYGYEGLGLLVEALRVMLPRYPRLRLLLVGGGPQESSLRAQVAACGLAEQVVFTGRVPHGEVPRYYELVDLLAYPRLPMRLTELVTPLKPLEAMALGRVLIASDVGGHRELIRDRETGFLFRAGNAASLAGALADALAKRSDWPAIRARARRYVEVERTWASSAAHYREVYAKALASLGRRVDH